ncbi:MAG: metal-dependent transcriptional regulator [Phycisphaerae bacterium]|nr:metal-dependent transcriptional regulator [Phycisphaerae bacterium]
MATEAVENYLKAILTLSQESDAADATITRIAAVVGVTPSTATTMVKRLDRAGLARYERYGAVRLTAKGRRAASDVLRRHRIVELFLVQIVGLDWSEVHAEAERLEHAISPRLLDRLDEMLGRPRSDPHGDPIPDADGRSDHARPGPITACAPGAHAAVARVLDQGAEFLQFLARAGLTPGTRVAVVAIDSIAGSITLKPEGRTALTLSLPVAQRILVTPAF